MTKPKTRLDDVVAALVEAHGPITNKALQGRKELRGIKVVGGYSRDLDGALQRLRKAGRISPTGKGWMSGARQQCPTCEGAGWVPW